MLPKEPGNATVIGIGLLIGLIGIISWLFGLLKDS